MQVIIRDFDLPNDAGFIFSTMPAGICFGLKKRPSPEECTLLQKQIRDRLNIIINIADIKIACNTEDPKFLLGYLITTKDQIEWLFVKPSYRKQGIGTLLFKNTQATAFNPDYLTKIGASILKNKAAKEEQKKKEQETI